MEKFLVVGNTEVSTKPGIFYEIFIRSFCDSDGDGIGDIEGIISRLDYLQFLGIEGIWVTPIHPSPSYHKYDVLDYYGVDREYGTLSGYKKLVEEAEKRGIRILLDLVMSHTSTGHPWFLASRRGEGDSFDDYYLWMSSSEIKRLGIQLRKSSADSQKIKPWHRVATRPEKFYGLFAADMADLNFDNPQVTQEILKVADFWLNEVGVYGFRIDAARHIFPYWRESENPAFWKEFMSRLVTLKPDAYVVGEVWASPEEIAPYFAGLPATFNFDLSLSLQEILQAEQDNDLIERLLSTYRHYSVHNPDFVDCIMLSNHDQERIGSVLNGQEEKLKLAASILLTLPGQVYIYYGEEIGMLGRKPDPNIREPFLWSENDQDTEVPTWIRPVYSTVAKINPLSRQLGDIESLFEHYRALIRIRKKFAVLGNQSNRNLEPFYCGTRTVIAYWRTDQANPVLILHNLSVVPICLLLDKITDHADLSILFATKGSDFLRENSAVELDGYGSVVLMTGAK